MIICTNCGSVNADNEGRICRKCGALLPISSKTPRIKITAGKKKSKKKNIENHNELIKISDINNSSKKKLDNDLNKQLIGETNFFHSQKNQNKNKKGKLDLQEIPKANNIEIDNFSEKEFSPTISKKDTLEEIEPTPYNGVVFSNNITENSIIKSQKTKEKLNPKIDLKIKPKKLNTPDTSNTVIRKQEQLENDMRDVLGFLSKKLEIPEEIASQKQNNKTSKIKEDIKPESMNQILTNLLSIDMHIEASAIIKNDGSILASAISDRISDTLFATIGQNLSMIGTDIINGLSAGKLFSIAIRGTEGVLHLAPLEQNNPNLNNMILIMFSNPKVKSGIVNLAKSNVRKQVKNYLGIE
ncbi:MAG: hypothetical protein JXA99_11740 [Candidatus Lokiarchaeota archaeon]|nr:hypothetical protein [Candidatus Lokiarchaeota archaeon]